MMYYFFNDLGDCFEEKYFATDEQASEYCEQIGADYFTCDD